MKNRVALAFMLSYLFLLGEYRAKTGEPASQNYKSKFELELLESISLLEFSIDSSVTEEPEPGNVLILSGFAAAIQPSEDVFSVMETKTNVQLLRRVLTAGKIKKITGTVIAERSDEDSEWEIVFDLGEFSLESAKPKSSFSDSVLEPTEMKDEVLYVARPKPKTPSPPPVSSTGDSGKKISSSNPSNRNNIGLNLPKVEQLPPQPSRSTFDYNNPPSPPPGNQPKEMSNNSALNPLQKKSIDPRLRLPGAGLSPGSITLSSRQYAEFSRKKHIVDPVSRKLLIVIPASPYGKNKMILEGNTLIHYMCAKYSAGYYFKSKMNNDSFRHDMVTRGMNLPPEELRRIGYEYDTPHEAFDAWNKKIIERTGMTGFEYIKLVVSSDYGQEALKTEDEVEKMKKDPVLGDLTVPDARFALNVNRLRNVYGYAPIQTNVNVDRIRGLLALEKAGLLYHFDIVPDKDYKTLDQELKTLRKERPDLFKGYPTEEMERLDWEAEEKRLLFEKRKKKYEEELPKWRLSRDSDVLELFTKIIAPPGTDNRWAWPRHQLGTVYSSEENFEKFFKTQALEPEHGKGTNLFYLDLNDKAKSKYGMSLWELFKVIADYNRDIFPTLKDIERLSATVEAEHAVTLSASKKAELEKLYNYLQVALDPQYTNPLHPAKEKPVPPEEN